MAFGRAVDHGQSHTRLAQTLGGEERLETALSSFIRHFDARVADLNNYVVVHSL